MPTIKVSNNAEKTTNPGIKQVYRFFDKDGLAAGDLIALDSEEIEFGRPYKFYHPVYFHEKYIIEGYSDIKPMLKLKMKRGKRIQPPAELPDIRNRVIKNLKQFDDTYKRIINPHIYKVSLSEREKKLKANLIDEYK